MANERIYILYSVLKTTPATKNDPETMRREIEGVYKTQEIADKHKRISETVIGHKTFWVTGYPIEEE